MLHSEGGLGADDLVVFLVAQVVLDGTTDVQVAKEDAGAEALVAVDDDVDVVVEEPVEELEFSWSEVAGLVAVVPSLGSAVRLLEVVDDALDVLVDGVLKDVLRFEVELWVIDVGGASGSSILLLN